MALCAFYLISVIGIGMNMHFCNGKLSSVQFTKSASCGVCKGDEKLKATDNCCKNTSVDVKVKDSHEAGFKIDLPQNFGVKLFLGPAITASFKAVLSKLFGRFENKAPPLSSLISLHIFNCVFRN